jgi:hypothetical protein
MTSQDFLVRSILELAPADGDHAALEGFFRRHVKLPTAVALGGCLAAELQIPLSGAGPAVVTALWQDEEAYHRWSEHPRHDDGASELSRVLGLRAGETRPPARLFRVAASAAAIGFPRLT